MTVCSAAGGSAVPVQALTFQRWTQIAHRGMRRVTAPKSHSGLDDDSSAQRQEASRGIGLHAVGVLANTAEAVLLGDAADEQEGSDLDFDCAHYEQKEGSRVTLTVEPGLETAFTFLTALVCVYRRTMLNAATADVTK